MNAEQSLAMRREAAAVLGSLLGYGPSAAALALGNLPPPERRSIPRPPSVWATPPSGAVRSGAAVVVASSTAPAAAPASFSKVVAAPVANRGVQPSAPAPPAPPPPSTASRSHQSSNTSSSTSIESEFSNVSISSATFQAPSASDAAVTTTSDPHPPAPAAAAAAPTVPSTEFLYCSSCSCALPAHLFSKAQRKKALVANPSSHDHDDDGGGNSTGSTATTRDGVHLGSGKCSSCLATAPQLLPTPREGGAKVNEYYCLTLHQPWASLVVAGVKRLGTCEIRHLTCCSIVIMRFYSFGR